MSDPAKLLVADHQKVERIFDEIHASEEVVPRQGLVAQLDFEFSMHATIEEQILYPFIRANVPEGDPMMEQAEHEHDEAKAALAALVNADPGGDAFEGAVRELEGLFKAHVKEEEKTVFPRLADATSPEALATLRADLEEAKFGSTEPRPLEAEAPAPAKKSAARKSTAKKATARKAAARKATAKKATARKATAKKAAVKKAAAKRAPAKRAAAKKAAVRKAAARKAPAKKATARKATARKAAAKKAPAKKSAAKKATAKRR
ncbi:MAG: hemerythrin domain-containing protein [Actinomycetota bacterium]|nr:hemerythrin domain-containing protein [Actinomycetota bacterium]